MFLKITFFAIKMSQSHPQVCLSVLHGSYDKCNFEFVTRKLSNFRLVLSCSFFSFHILLKRNTVWQNLSKLSPQGVALRSVAIFDVFLHERNVLESRWVIRGSSCGPWLRDIRDIRSWSLLVSLLRNKMLAQLHQYEPPEWASLLKNLPQQFVKVRH